MLSDPVISSFGLWIGFFVRHMPDPYCRHTAVHIAGDRQCASCAKGNEPFLAMMRNQIEEYRCLSATTSLYAVAPGSRQMQDCSNSLAGWT